MTVARMLSGLALAGGTISVAYAQIPDLLTSLDAGTRAMGMAGSINAAGSDTASSLNNPAGLAYATAKQVGVAIRTLPESATTWSNSYRNPTSSTSGHVGRFGLTHAGIIIPVKRKGGSGNSAWGISYNTTGFIRDARQGTGLALDATTSYDNYTELLEAKTDLFAASYGWTNGDQTLALGVGAVVAQQYVYDFQSYNVTSSGTQIGSSTTSLSSNGTGIGVVGGIQILPPRVPNLSVGFTARSPITLTGNSNTKSIYNRIPGKLSAGFAYRKDGLRSGNDYLIFGGQFDAFFHNDASVSLDRRRRINVGAGWEYGYLAGDVRIPIRVGFSLIPAAGTNFRDRNALTFGVGYRPIGAPYSVDLNFTGSSASGFDTGIMFNYKFGK